MFYDIFEELLLTKEKNTLNKINNFLIQNQLRVIYNYTFNPLLTILFRVQCAFTKQDNIV